MHPHLKLVLGALAMCAAGCHRASPTSNATPQMSLTAVSDFLNTNGKTFYPNSKDYIEYSALSTTPDKIVIENRQWSARYPRIAKETQCQVSVKWTSLKGAELADSKDGVQVRLALDPPGTARFPDPSLRFWRKGPALQTLLGFQNEALARKFYELFKDAAEKHGAILSSESLKVVHLKPRTGILDQGIHHAIDNMKTYFPRE